LPQHIPKIYVVATASSCPRRFLATPLDEIVT
jgi:hypothetical protein